MDAPRLRNETEFVAEPRSLLGKDGERLLLIVKATFVCGPGKSSLELAPRRDQRGIRAADVPWGEPEVSSIKYPSDLCVHKPGTDVVVVAAAHSPGDHPLPFFDVGVRAGSLSKTVRVFGLRVWQEGGAGLSSPRPTTGMEVRYDYAWGGFDASDVTRPVEDARNPVGMGTVRDPKALTHKAAPFLEDPAFPIASAKTRPPPAGLGVVGRHWEPRRRLFGTYDAAWLATRAPLLPLDHDDRANLCASPGLTATPPLVGGEEVALMGLTPGGGVVTFRLPKIRVTAAMRSPGREVELATPFLDTVVLDTLAVKDPGEVVVELVWRAAFVPPRRLKNAELVVREEEVR